MVLTTIGGSMLAISSTTCSLVPTSNGAFGITVVMDLKNPFGWYFGSWSNWRNLSLSAW